MFHSIQQEIVCYYNQERVYQGIKVHWHSSLLKSYKLFLLLLESGVAESCDNIDTWYVTTAAIIVTISMLVCFGTVSAHAASPARRAGLLKGPLCDKSVISDRRETSLDWLILHRRYWIRIILTITLFSYYLILFCKQKCIWNLIFFL